jgi:uncharacterized protein YchJ
VWCVLRTAVEIETKNFRIPGGLLCHKESSRIRAFRELEAAYDTTYSFRADEQTAQRLPVRNTGQEGRVVHGDKELLEKLGRNDLCPCGSGKRFKKCCMKSGQYDGSKKDYYF